MMEKSPSSVKGNLTQVQQNGPHQDKNSETQSLLSLWTSHQKSYSGTLDENGDTPEVSGVTPVQNIPEKKFSWNPLRKVDKDTDGPLGKTKRFSKTGKGTFDKEWFSTDFPKTQPKPFKSKGSLTQRIKRSQLLSGLIQTKRVSYCGKTNFNSQEVVLDGYKDTCKKTGLQVCGNVWECPTCRPYIHWKIREQIRSVQTLSTEKNEKQFMVTLTVNHNKKESLLWNVNLINDGWNSLRNDRHYIRLMSRLGHSWTLRTLEVTWGRKSGFHPHFHLLLSVKEDVTHLLQEIKNIITETWGRIIQRIRNRQTITDPTLLNTSPWTNDKTVYISKVDELGPDYFIKWTTGDEMTRGIDGKKGKNGNYSIGELEVEMTKQFESTGQIDPELREVLTEFYTTMKRKKFHTKTGNYQDYLAAIEDDQVEKTEREMDEVFNTWKGKVVVKEWFWDNILHKWGITFDLIGEVKCREKGEEFWGIRDWLLWEVWKVTRLPWGNLQHLIDTNVYIETEE